MFDPEDERFGRQGPLEDNGPADDSQEESVSLEGLSEAFAEALGKSDQNAYEEDIDQEAVAPSEDEHTQHAQEWSYEGGEDDETEPGFGAEDDESQEGDEGLPDVYQNDPQDDEDPCPISPHTILEAMLFVGNISNRPLESRQAAELMRGVEPEEIPEIVGQLNESYAENGCPYSIVAEGAGYRMKLNERFHALRNRFYGRVREARLSQAAIDVLAIVAYRQPISSEAVNRMRDKPCSHLLSQLVRRRLLQIERPADKSSKPVYRTTERFLELFGLDDISELPKSEGVID
ncbi:MAG: SMC-Scp complex subunit ScpB [Pirellulales bacterium]|nr:SMC-Scp complex subunit ScpB [Pirellulales bacterium]